MNRDNKAKIQQQTINDPTPLDSEVQDGNPLPTVSGPIKELPWDNDESFVNSKAKYNTPVLLGAYCAVLKDPLPGEEYNVHLAASKLCGKVLKPSQIFSQNREIGPYSKARGFKEGPTYIGTEVRKTIGGGVCKISSTLYNVAILSNLVIMERHNHGMPVPYVPYGQDATVAEGVKDLKFKNNTSFPILIWSQGVDNRLYIAFYGQEQPPKVEWEHEFIKVYNAPTLYRKTPKLERGTEKLVLEGMDGATVKSSVTITYQDGRIERKSLGTSYYSPMPHVIEKGI